MSNVICIDACTTLICPLDRHTNAIRIPRGDVSQFLIPPGRHTYLRITDGNNSEEVRFNGAVSIDGVMTVERTKHLPFGVGATVCFYVGCGYLSDLLSNPATAEASNLLLTDNIWLGTNTFKTVTFAGATWSDEDTEDRRLQKTTSGIWVDLNSSINDATFGYLSTVTRAAGLFNTYGGKFVARVVGPTTGPVYGTSSEAWLEQTATTAAYAAHFTLFNAESSNTSPKRGVVSRFANRSEGTSGVASGLASNRYNTTSVGVSVESQGRSSAGEFCGWLTGIRFDANALDETATTKAVGLDFALLEPTLNRIGSLIRLPNKGTVEWNADSSLVYTSITSKYDRSVDRWSLTKGVTSRFEVSLDNSMLSFNDTGATTPLVTPTAGAVTGTFLPVVINGVTYKLELRAV